MEAYDPLLSILAFFGVILLIIGLGWLIKNKTPLGDLNGPRPVFDMRGSYRIDSKTKLVVFGLDDTTFYVMIGTGSICMLHKVRDSDPHTKKEMPSCEEKGEFEREFSQALKKGVE